MKIRFFINYELEYSSLNGKYNFLFVRWVYYKMVKYKFPGKPSKLVQRTLVSAFSVSVPSCDTSTIIENVCCGISVFEDAFGDEDDALDFAGFSDEQIELSLLKKEKLVHDVTEKCSARGLTYSCTTNAEHFAVATHRIAQEKKEKSEITLIIAVEPDISVFPNEKKKERRKCGKIWFVTKKMVNQYNPKISMRHGFKKNRLLRFKHKSLSSNYLSDRFRRKFIVPSRSLHSSRVIKPTRRLIENEKRGEKAGKSLDKSEEDYKLDVHDITLHDDRSKLDVSSSKVIIREARLNITTETAITGPFSMKNIPRVSNNNNGSVHKENTRIDNSSAKGNIILRGPRIKHVCRSASSVLRTSSEGDTDDSGNGSSLPDSSKSAHRGINLDTKGDRGSQLNRIRQCSDGNFSLADSQNDEESSQYHRARSLQDFSKESSDDLEEHDREDKLISIDFWEAYDPDEVCKTGFPVISSERLNVRALCFLCGSAGIEKLLYCVACCEPYHWYCAEGPSAFREEAELERYRVNWICRKCKVCSICDTGGDLRTLSSCKRCRNSYHFECLNDKTSNKRLFKSDRPWVCPSCLKCKSCNCSNVFTHVGNIPLCSQCFKLRQKGNYCPLCQGCYQDEDYNVQMMECGICKCWIHAKCEGISSEKYQILSFLPDSVEFVCKLCCTVPPAQWWLAVEDELKAGFYGVLKSLCNNKKIGDMLKESPRKDRGTCSCDKFDNETPRAAAIDTEENLNSSLTHCKRALNFDVKGETVICADDTSSTKLSDDEAARKCASCCNNVKIRNSISERLLVIKANVRTNQYASVFAFNQQLENVMAELEESESMTKYREILKQFFPWFNPEDAQHEEVQNKSIETVTKENASVLNRNEDSFDQDDEYLELRKRMSADEYDYENFKMLDVRRCKFCQGLGEAIASEGGRLIYCGRNEWVHSNCALWSSEVFEEIDGSLQNVHSAISRGRQISCSSCGRKGASVGCCFKNCALTYHFLCAQKSKCVFLQNKTIYCNNHDLKDNNLQLLVDENDFEILRPVYIEMDRKKKKHEYHANVRLRIGSLHVESLGRIDPHLSDNPRYILPMYFRCTRLFWSTVKPWKIVQYHIQIKLKYLYEDKSETDNNYTVDHSNDEVQRPVQRSPSSSPKPSVEASSSPHPLLPKNKNKRKIEAEEMAGVPFVKSKMRANGYLSAARLNHVVVELPQLDGMMDVYADEEPEPVTCVQCHRTYRTAFSYERHLDTCSADFGDFMISSCESDSVSSEEDKLSACGGAAGAKIGSLESSPMIDLAPMNTSLTSKYAESYFIDNNEKVTTTAVPTYGGGVATNVDVNSILYPCTPMNYEDAHLVNNVLPVTLVQNVKQDAVGVVTPQSINLPVASADPTIKFTFIDNNGKINGVNANYNAQLAAPQPYSIQNVSAGPTYVIQQPYQKPTDMIPTFVAVDNTPPLQQIQLQPLAQSSVNFQSVMPTILGAVMQPNIIEATPTAYIVNTSTPADLYAAQNVLIPSQPMIFGMETVVSNTVMSSSHQFMTQSLTGANIGSSTLYSTTTTQVFQAAKQLQSQSAAQPDLSSGYIVLNAPAVSSESQSSMQTMRTVPARAAEPINKYMYVQVNNEAKRVAPPSSVAAKKVPPVILKPAVKPPPLAKKNTKVMKLKNNRPIAIQTAGNVIPLADSARDAHHLLDEDEVTTPFCRARKNLQITTTNKTVLCGQSAPDTSLTKMVVCSANNETKDQMIAPNAKNVLSASKRTNIPLPVALIPSESASTPVVQLSIPHPVDLSEAGLDEEFPVGPSVLPTDGLEITEAVGSELESLTKRLANERTAGVKIAQPTPPSPLIFSADSRKERTAAAILNGSKITPVTRVPNKLNASPTITLARSSNLCKESGLPSIVLNERNIADFSSVAMSPNKTLSDTEQKENSAPSMPLLDLFEAEHVPDKKNAIDNCSTTGAALFTESGRRKYVPKMVSRNVDIAAAPKSAPTVVESNARSSPSETDRIFDELVRQHKLSLESKKVAKDKQSPSPTAAKVTIPHLKSREEFANRSPQSTKTVTTAAAPTETSETSKESPAADPKDPKEKEDVTAGGERSAESKNWKTASISFEVNAEDGFSYKTNDLHDLWNKILESVQHSRNEYNLPLLPKNALVNAESVYGLLGYENKASKFLLEQLPDAWKCIFYKPVFHKSPLYGKPSPVENVSGCARTEPFTSSHKFDMFGWLASRHRKPPKFMIVSDSDIVNGNRRITSLNLPMAMRFRHLKETAKETVGVFRSDIHGRGLFCLRDIDAGEMVIEYAGEVIRSTLTDKREKYYTARGIGCYMFRIDDSYVVDATMCGNAARFINHSCDPNCYSRIVDILGKKHILIFALRRILKGEELTYDYKFPLEDDKIHCHCLARKCRKYLN